MTADELTADQAADNPVTMPDPARSLGITVQHSLAPPDGRTKYVDQIVDGAAPGVRIRYFSTRAALFGRYDVFHAHWPELMIRGTGRLRRFGRRRAMDLLLLKLRIQQIALVRTVHNVHPHEPGPASEQRSLARFDKAVDLFIRLNPTTGLPVEADSVVILHGHYVDQFAVHPCPPSEPGRVLYFGIIRAYKGVDRLFDAFRQLDDPALSLRVVGSPSRGQRDLVTARCRLDDRSSAVLRYVEDEELVDEIGRAELVVLPYREMHNSGSILVALSLARPVLVPRAPANTVLSTEVGPGWVIEYDGELGPEHIRAALELVRQGPPQAAPDLSRRDWRRLGDEHLAAYERAISRVRTTA
ncbi:MAG: GDP-mannose--glycolipid 4-beta-D-mannosyltransferase [Nakamurella sp.]